MLFPVDYTAISKTLSETYPDSRSGGEVAIKHSGYPVHLPELRASANYSDEMVEFETYSHNGGREALESKDLLDNVLEIPLIWTEYPYQRDYSEQTNAVSVSVHSRNI
ncbi:hypothetical protein PN413_14105 [Halorubrum ezzemoulense]|nr:hypothetical protein [Halorubrum ezzemoulense]